MRTAFIIILCLLFFDNLFADIIRVPSDISTVVAAVAAAEEGDTVLLEPGNHFGSVILNEINLTLASEFILSGDSADISNTDLLPSQIGSVVTIEERDSTTVIAGLTIRGGSTFEGGGIRCENASPVIRNNIIEENTADAGGGIYCTASSPRILYNIIRGNEIMSPIGNPGGGICMDNNSNGEIGYNLIMDNLNQDGAGIACVNSDPWIHHNVIVENQAFDLGGAMRMDQSHPLLENNVFADNQASQGGGLFINMSSNPVVRNCIIWGNDASLAGDQIRVADGVPSFSYCDVEDGWNGNNIIDENPLFRNPANLDYHLQSDSCGNAGQSPCIDAGDPAWYDALPNCDWGLGEPRSDMGAYGGGSDSVVSTISSPPLAVSYFTCSAYPNPFNSHTTLLFSLPNAANVDLKIFDISGRQILERHFGQLERGEHRYSIDASGFASGLFLVQLNSGQRLATAKLLHIK